MSADDNTFVREDWQVVDESDWHALGQQELTALPQPSLLDAKTSRAVRVLCWTLTVILWLGLLLGAVAVLGLAVGIANNPGLT